MGCAQARLQQARAQREAEGETSDEVAAATLQGYTVGTAQLGSASNGNAAYGATSSLGGGAAALRSAAADGAAPGRTPGGGGGGAAAVDFLPGGATPVDVAASTPAAAGRRDGAAGAFCPLGGSCVFCSSGVEGLGLLVPQVRPESCPSMATALQRRAKRQWPGELPLLVDLVCRSTFSAANR